MKLFAGIILFFLFVFLCAGLILLWVYLEHPEQYLYRPYAINISEYISSNTSQFYSNMRYRDRVITYTIERACDAKKAESARTAFRVLDERTIVSFQERPNGEIVIFCSELAPEPKETGHFVAGEGGPSEIINASIYSVILSGKVSLFRDETCKEPNVALHEILHALGFNHNSDELSIMYPITNCKQTLDRTIIDQINLIYAQNSYPDAIIERVQANRTGRYLNFDISIGNYGLTTLSNTTLEVFSGDLLLRTFDLGTLDIGTRKFLTVTNIRAPKDATNIIFNVHTPSQELSKQNNRASISLD